MNSTVINTMIFLDMGNKITKIVLFYSMLLMRFTYR